MGSKSAVDDPLLKAGENSLSKAFNEHRDALRNYLTRRLKCADTADDLTQETWIKANHGVSAATPISNPRAYLFTLAANLATDYLRVEARRKELRSEHRDVLWEGIDSLTPEKYAIAHDELKVLREAAAQLRPLSRKIFYLNRFSGLTYEEISDQLGVSKTTVANHIRSVLDHLAAAQKFHSNK